MFIRLRGKTSDPIYVCVYSIEVVTNSNLSVKGGRTIDLEQGEAEEIMRLISRLEEIDAKVIDVTVVRDEGTKRRPHAGIGLLSYNLDYNRND